jgi:helix-turn-helix protein
VNAVEDEKRSDKEDSVPVPQVLRVAEVAEYLRVHPATVYRLLRVRNNCPAFEQVRNGASALTKSIAGAAKKSAHHAPRGAGAKPLDDLGELILEATGGTQ